MRESKMEKDHTREIAAVKSEMSEFDKRHGKMEEEYKRELSKQKEEMHCKMAELKVTITSSTLSL